VTDERICRWCFSELPEDSESLCPSCAEKETLLKEGLATGPEEFGKEDFDRFLWKLAAYAIKVMEHPEGGTPWTIGHMRDSLMLAVLQALPMDHVSMSFKFSPDRKPGDPPKDVAYTIKKPIPRILLFKTVERLGIWSLTEKDEPDNFAGA
jgi:hypothetical protein